MAERKNYPPKYGRGNVVLGVLVLLAFVLLALVILR